jgi:hypothetical protein
MDRQDRPTQAGVKQRTLQLNSNFRQGVSLLEAPLGRTPFGFFATAATRSTDDAQGSFFRCRSKLERPEGRCSTGFRNSREKPRHQTPDTCTLRHWLAGLRWDRSSIKGSSRRPDCLPALISEQLLRDTFGEIPADPLLSTCNVWRIASLHEIARPIASLLCFICHRVLPPVPGVQPRI